MPPGKPIVDWPALPKLPDAAVPNAPDDCFVLPIISDAVPTPWLPPVIATDDRIVLLAPSDPVDLC